MIELSQIGDNSSSSRSAAGARRPIRWTLVLGVPAGAAVFAAILLIASPLGRIAATIAAPETSRPEIAEGMYVPIPEVVANLSDGARPHFVKVRVTLKASNPASAQAIAAHERELLDVFNGYLHALQAEELFGASGFERLRAGLRRRAELVLGPEAEHLEDVLIVEFIRQ